MVEIWWFGSLENGLVAKSDDERAGTWKQFGIDVRISEEVYAWIVPEPMMGVVVTPSASVADCFWFQCVYVEKRSEFAIII